jgi:dipeptidyl aminopeptidase/acylaminoacyl peptidase
VWSPDGTKIAFQGIFGSSGRAVWIVNADGTDLHVVPNLPPGYAGLPRFSRDGTKLLFGNVVGTGDQPAVWYVIGTDGSNLTQVGPTDRYVADAAFSPDGTKIVFSSFPVAWGSNTSVTDAASGLYLMDADGSNVVQITHGNDAWVSWQPRLSVPPNLPPRALGTAQNSKPLALFANADASFDGDGTIAAYEWRWGDNTAMSPHKYAWHKYAKPGTYLVRLTVRDNNGAATTKKAWVKVN